MKYSVKFTKQSAKDLKNLDKHTRGLILGWIEKNLEGCENPRVHGRGLTANHSGKWRYRIGNYRLIADIQDSEVVILVLKVGHRREVYD